MRRYEYKIQAVLGDKQVELISYIKAPYGFMIEKNSEDEICLVPCPHIDIVKTDARSSSWLCQKCEQIIEPQFLRERILL